MRDVMVEGPTGVLAVHPGIERPVYEPSKRRLTWSNGAVATTFSAEEPDLLRGPEFDGAWADELAAWDDVAAWDNLLLGLRIGARPQAVATTTPRPIALLHALLDDPTCRVIRGTTYENLANLAPDFRTRILSRYEGTRLARQELLGELLEESEGALWRRAWFEHDGFRVAPGSAGTRDLMRVVVAVDPALTSGARADETGIVVVGRGADRRGYVLADVSLRGSPDAWGRRAVAAWREYRADRIVAEANNGGEMVGLTLRTVDAAAPVSLVHASRGKRTRAEPVSALYEQGRVSHVGRFDALEDQLVTWTPDDAESPDRLDALVWGLTALLIDESAISAAEAAQATFGPTGVSRWRR